MTKLPKDIRNALSIDSSVIDPRFKQKLKNQIIKGEDMSQSQPKLNIFSIKNLLPLVGASLVLAGAVGVGSYIYSSNNSKKELLSEIQLPTDLSDLRPIDEIRSIATIGLASDVSISGIELEQEDGVLLYKVKYSNGTYKLFDAKTGEMVVKNNLEIDASVPADFVAGVSIDRAREIAQSVYPDRTIVKIELETENGAVVYNVRFSDDSRVYISASDGSVVQTKDGVSSDDNSNEDSDDSVDSEDHAEEDTEDDGDKSGSGSDKSSGSSDESDDKN